MRRGQVVTERARGAAHRFGVDQDKPIQEAHASGRVTTLCKKLLDLDGVTVTKVEFLEGELVAEVALRRRRLVCPHCGYTARVRYDTRTVASRWRGLDVA